MGIVLATFLSTRPPTLHALSFATKDSIFTVQSVEHARLIINGMELWPYAKASYYYFRSSKIRLKTFLKYCLEKLLQRNFDTIVLLWMFSWHFGEQLFYNTLVGVCFYNFKISYTLELLFTLFVKKNWMSLCNFAENRTVPLHMICLNKIL